MKRKKEQIVTFPILLLLVIQGAVHCIFCTHSCNCTFWETSIGMIECEWDNSSVRIGISYSFQLDDYESSDSDTISEYSSQFVGFNTIPNKILVKCQGTSYHCEDLPEFDDSEEFPVQLYINSCTSDILECFIQVYPHVSPIHGLTLYNTIDITPDMIFNTWSGVEEITFKNTDIKMSPNMFNGIPVKHVVFDTNRINGIPNNTFDGAALVYLEISSSNVEHITKSAFKGLNTLQQLVLRNNTKLKSLDPQLLSETKNLVFLTLVNNRIKHFSKELLNNLNEIRHITIEDNLIKISLNSQSFAYTSLTQLTVSNSKVDFLPEDLLQQSNVLTDFNFKENMIKHLPHKLFWYTTSLRYINLSYNKIQIIPEDLFSKLPQINHVDLRNNDIVELNTPLFQTFSLLSNLWLDFNKIIVLNVSAFEYYTVKNLSLASNKIKTINTTRVMWSVWDLDLSDNDITVFDYWLYDRSNGRRINLTRNKINIIEEKNVNAYGGTQIDLRDNNISSIIGDSNRSSKDVTWSLLYMANNPLEPSCEVITILKDWNLNGRLLDHENVTFVNGEYLSNTKLYSVCDTGDIEIALIGSSAVGALITLIIVVSIIRHRNGIWKYLTNICYRKKSRVKPDEIRLNQYYTYDIFISFAYQDRDFVIDVLLPKLENNFNQKVCVHFRDWTVGDLIPDQIIKSVERSTMTILILTEYFLDSEWSQLEFHTAHNLGKQEQRSKVIIIILNSDIIRNERLTTDLKSYMEINNYLLWNDIDFWEKLQEALPRQGKKIKGRRHK